MPYIPAQKAALLVPSGPQGFHLFTVLTNACADGSHLLVSISSVRDGKFCDPACIVHAGEHEFIKQRSFVEYRRLTMTRGVLIAKNVDGGVYQAKPPVSDALFTRICAGMDETDFGARGMHAYFQKNKNR